MLTAILVDGGFYRKRAHALWGDKSAEERARELEDYCKQHILKEHAELYRVFYYDCPCSTESVYHPLKQKNINLRKSDVMKWSSLFFEELKKKRKFALRLGRLSKLSSYSISKDATKALLSGKKQLSDLTDQDFYLDIVQKGVDMRIGLDIASLAYKKLVRQIILISGDSDFVPAAKLARREGIDFILDPLWAHIEPDLFEHIDGLYSCCEKPKPKIVKQTLTDQDVSKNQNEGL